MYLPAATVATTMAAETTQGLALELNPEITSSTATSIYIKWAWEGVGSVYVSGFRVYHHRVASHYVQYSRELPPTTTTYGITNLVADTNYKVCVAMMGNGSVSLVNECVAASTTSWHIPVSIGSSIGAVLALSIIVLIVLLSRCPNLVRQPRTAAAESSKYDSMSSHFPDDRYEMSDTTTHCHDHEPDEDVFSQNSEGDSLADSKSACRHNYHYSPQSLADRLCNGGRLTNGIGKPARAPVPLSRCGRTLSLTDKRHPPPSHRARQARLAHLHANFHSIQSEPGSIPIRAAPRVSITDFPASVHSPDLAAPRKTPHHSSLPGTSVNNGRGTATPECNAKSTGQHRDNPRIMYRIESATSTSEPIVAEVSRSQPRARPPVLKNISKTIHMSIDGDTLV